MTKYRSHNISSDRLWWCSVSKADTLVCVYFGSHCASIIYLSGLDLNQGPKFVNCEFVNRVNDWLPLVAGLNRPIQCTPSSPDLKHFVLRSEDGPLAVLAAATVLLTPDVLRGPHVRTWEPVRRHTMPPCCVAPTRRREDSSRIVQRKLTGKWH